MNTHQNFDPERIYHARSGVRENTLTAPLDWPRCGASALCIATAHRLAQSAKERAAVIFVSASHHKGDFHQYLATSRPGRVILHALCLLHRPDRFMWHWHGILRELAV